METIKQKLSVFFKKYKYAALVVLIGIFLLLIPGKTNNSEVKETITEQKTIQSDLAADLESILSEIAGAGRVEVMLTVSRGQQTYYQYNSDQSTSDSASNINTDTVIIMDSAKNEHGMISRIDPAQYQGAVVLCQGADSPEIRLSIIDAVSKVTGLGADKICVLKMK